MENFYVYAHIDKETKTPFYIGRGIGKRAKDKSQSQYWQNFVSKYSRDYQIEFLAKDVSDELALDIEHEFISKLGKAFNGEGMLLNWASGGYAEGAYIEILNNGYQGFFNDLTEFGKQLITSDQSEFNLHKIRAFINEMVEDIISQFQRQMEIDLIKKTNPKKAWIIPFCLDQKVKKSDNFTIQISKQLNCIIPIDHIGVWN